MSNYDTKLGLSMPLHLDPSWTDEINFNWAAIGNFIAPDDCYFVSPGFTTGNLYQSTAPSDRRHFPTIQEAITVAQSTSYSSRNTIYIYPGEYSENVTISGNITLVGTVTPMREGLGGGAAVRISGTTSLAGSVVTINPDGVGLGSVNLINLCLENQYNVDNSTEITEPYLIKITKPATYDQRAVIGMKNCQCRMQTAGDNNLWTYGVRGEGMAKLTMRDCDFTSWGYAGGEYNGGIRNMFSLRGDHSGGNSFLVYGERLNVSQSFDGVGGSTPILFDIDNGVLGEIGRSNFKKDSLLVQNGATGTNVITGLEGSTIAQYGNLDGIVLSWL